MSKPYQAELAAALRAVSAAGKVCRAIQSRLVTPETIEKKDKSPVTVADFASQAVVCSILSEAFPHDPVVGEEHAGELRQAAQAAARGVVVRHVEETLGRTVGEPAVMDWIDRGQDAGTSRRYWTLDPIDGTKGFLRGGQYAVALALIEEGKVVLGVLGCPNLPMAGVTGLLSSNPPAAPGIVLFASRGVGAFVESLWEPTIGGGPDMLRARVSGETNPALARFCESVESGHSDQSGSAKIAKLLGITAPPLRMDSQCKYATVARGEASIYLRLPTKADYREFIWDHAAGVVVVEEAGGRVTDVEGMPLDFSLGRRLENNRGIIATSGPIHDAVVEAVKQGRAG